MPIACEEPLSALENHGWEHDSTAVSIAEYHDPDHGKMFVDLNTGRWQHYSEDGKKETAHGTAATLDEYLHDLSKVQAKQYYTDNAKALTAAGWKEGGTGIGGAGRARSIRDTSFRHTTTERGRTSSPHCLKARRVAPLQPSP